MVRMLGVRRNTEYRHSNKNNNSYYYVSSEKAGKRASMDNNGYTDGKIVEIFE